FQRLKIDRTLVAQAAEDAAAEAMLHASIALARVLGMTVVAEGVETEAQCEAMLAAGCDLMQGWLFARDMTMQQVARQWQAPAAPGRRRAAAGARRLDRAGVRR
ncbi:MAG: EAL domain-containing protein, partial [Sphingomonadaceae bacterium]